MRATKERYTKKFALLQEQRQKAFIPFVPLGWPDKQRSLEIMKQIIDSEVTALELGWAFIQAETENTLVRRVAFETLATGLDLYHAIELISELRTHNDTIPIGLCVNQYILEAANPERVISLAADAELDSITVADMTFDKMPELVALCSKYGISFVGVASLDQDIEQLNLILKNAQAYINIVGDEKNMLQNQQRIIELKDQLKSKTTLPILWRTNTVDYNNAKSIFSIGFDGLINCLEVIKIVDDANDNFKDKLRSYFSSMIMATKYSNN